MKIYCNKSELYRALNNAIQAVPSRSTSKILEGVLIETKEDEMIITGTDAFMVVNPNYPQSATALWISWHRPHYLQISSENFRQKK